MRIDIRHIARLAMLELPEDLAEKYETEFAALLAKAEQWPEPENAGRLWEPEDRMPLRADEIAPSFPRDVMLQNASHADAGCIVVSNIVE